MTRYATWLNGCWQCTHYDQQMPYNWLPLFNGVRDSRPTKALLRLISDCVMRHIGKVSLLFLEQFKLNDQNKRCVVKNPMPNCERR